MRDYLVAEITARVAYTELSWRERLVTPPPPGWPGAWTARLVSWCARFTPRRPNREEES